MKKIPHWIISHLIPIVIGAAVAGATGVFDTLVYHLSTIWQNNLLASKLGVPNAWLRASLPIIAIPFIVFVLRRIPGERQHSQADIIEGIHVHQGVLDLKSAWYSIVGALISLGSGYSVGQYGPTVQQGSAVAYGFLKVKWFHTRNVHVWIAAGVAAAIAAIFHAPIAAVVFAHEVILRFFSIRAFAPITISAVSSYVISSEVFHRTTFLNSTDHVITTPLIYGFVIALAIFAGMLGTLFIRSILTIQLISKRQQIPLTYRITLAACIMSVIAYYFPDAMGISAYFLHGIVNQYEITASIIATILIVKFIATVSSIGLGVPGGVFSPAIFIGALLGSLTTQLLSQYLPGGYTATGLLTITTMAAMASAVMGAPISMILIVLEITDNFTLTSAVMLAVVIANITAYRLIGAYSFFDAQLKARGINMEVGRDLMYLKQHNIHHLISNNFIKINAETGLREAEVQLLEQRQSSAYIVKTDNQYKGKIHLIDIRHALREGEHDKTVLDIAQVGGEELYRLSTIWEAIELMGRFDGTLIPILESPENPTLIGVLYESALISEYLKNIRRIRAHEN